VGFETPLPDFTDCSFASREPAGDWVIVARHGGPVRVFDRMMPSFGDVLTEEELGRAVEYAKGFCTDNSWPAGELNLPRPLMTEKAYPEDEAVLTTTASAEGPGAITNKLVYEKRFGARNQIEVAVPFGWRDGTPGGWSAGLGDIALGVKRTLFHSLSSGSVFSVTGEVILPTGDAATGFGKGVTVFEPFVGFGQILPADSFLQFQGGLELPADTELAPREAFWRTAVGKSFSQGFGRTWSPMLEILGSRDLVSGARTDWDVVPQMQVTLSKRQHIMLNAGVRVPITDRGPRRTQFMAYLLWDWFDGGFFEGW
jgi:hypothetical protein